SDTRIARYENVALYNDRTATVTGVMIIELPPITSNTMLNIRVSGYQYEAGYGAYEFIIGGYARGGGATWDWTTANGGAVIGNPPGTRVRLAADSASQKHYIILGDTDTVWRYPAIT